MNIKTLHSEEKEVSAKPLFKGSEGGNTTSLRISKGGQLKAHTTKVPALLICIEGQAQFGNELGIRTDLFPGDYVLIDPLIVHYVNGISDCQLLLLK